MDKLVAFKLQDKYNSNSSIIDVVQDNYIQKLVW